MAQTVNVIVGAEDRARLAALLGDRNLPHKHVQRVNIIVLSAERLPVQEVARRAGVSRPAVWRWQVRYAEQGVDALRECPEFRARRGYPEAKGAPAWHDAKSPLSRMPSSTSCWLVLTPRRRLIRTACSTS
nr:helix-turn-helix domain-containing protein [Azospirillum sp. B506]